MHTQRFKGFVAAGWALGAYFGGAACALGAAALIQQDQNPLFPIVLGLTIVPPCVYFAIKNTIEAWQKPKKLLANAMRIKDYLFNK